MRRRFRREQLIDRFAPGKSFADVGCMWSVDGAIAFRAEAAGAASVTASDLMDPSPRYLAEHDARGSAIRYVQGDLHAPDTSRAIGTHDVVWCSGVIYHAPDPMRTLRVLRDLTGETLLLGSEVIRERRRRRAAVFAPGPRLHPGITSPFDPSTGYGAWWWGFTPSSLRAMCAAAGLTVHEEHGTRWYRVFVARPGP